MIRTELTKLFRRPRTWGTLILLNALPITVAIFLAVTHVGPRAGQGPAFLSAVLANGSLFAVAALAIVLPLFLPVAVSVIAGDAVAGEAQGGTLRYLLIRPVGRTRLLVAKLTSVFAFVVVAVVTVAGIGYVTGRLLLGGGGNGGLISIDAATSISGSELSTGQIVLRTAVAIAFVAVSMLGVAAAALFLSTLTDSPISAALGAMALLIGSSLFLTLDAADAVKPYLPTRYWLSFTDLFRDPILWRNVERGVLLQGVYVVLLLGAAWANFATKDITS
jgi:ABC-2 type transport system permease protein